MTPLMLAVKEANKWDENYLELPQYLIKRASADVNLEAAKVIDSRSSQKFHLIIIYLHSMPTGPPFSSLLTMEIKRWCSFCMIVEPSWMSETKY